MRLVIASTWDGSPALLQEQVVVELRREGEWLCVQIDAPFYDDPRPLTPPTSTPGLWKFEVVELMLLGLEQHYLELEFGPHGHYLALQLHGPRRVQRSGLALEYMASIEAGRFQACARVPCGWLPSSADRVNAFAIHGVGPERRYLAWRGAPGAGPDFHRLELFGALELGV